DPGGGAEGGGRRAGEGAGGAIQPGRLPQAGHRYRGTAAVEITRPAPFGGTMATPVSPLAVPLPHLPPLAGVRLGAAAVGIRYQGRTDVVMIDVPAGSAAAGVFTSNKCPGAPVDWCRGALKGRKARLVVVNAGNANVFTGRAGREACAATANAAAQLVN